MQKRWIVRNPNPQAQVNLSNSLGIHPIIAQILVNRHIEDVKEAQDFLLGDLSRLHDPFCLKDMDKAVERIQKAQKNKERILIFGDYDADGITSSAILKMILTRMGLDVMNYIPHRMSEGYGLNHKIAEFAKEKGVRLLIAVDCGISAFEEVETINKIGIDVIILDHHEPPKEKLPLAVAVINPKRTDCSYPSKGLAAVGLVFKLAQALTGETLEDFLDLVALGTIADVVELKGENRIFVKEGLRRIEKTKNNGLLALMQTSGIKGKKINPYSIGFILGPRINAAGRLGSAEKSLELLLSSDFEQALILAQALEDNNRLRQKTQKEIVQEALSIVEREVNFKDERVIVLSKEGWHRGVIGIVAARIVDTYHRPTIVISLEDGIGTGSARSIEPFHLFKALTNCASFLEDFGGHEHAAGLTIRMENIDRFREAINAYALETLDAEDLTPTLDLDCEIPLTSLNVEFIKSLEILQPFGEENPPPIFCSRHLTLKGPASVLGKDTLKFWVSDGQVTVQAVGFGMAGYADLVNQAKELDLAYEPTVDDWNKEPIVQLKLKDIKES